MGQEETLYGTDLRQIPTDDIEKIEVIAGIPDAKYGDLTSGLIKVETKTGKKPSAAFDVKTIIQKKQ
jgi:outer membrane cobalamin receptor